MTPVATKKASNKRPLGCKHKLGKTRLMYMYSNAHVRVCPRCGAMQKVFDDGRVGAWSKR